MNFFAAQEQARVRTRWLILLFVIAVAGLILLTHFILSLGLWFATFQLSGEAHFSITHIYDQLSLEQSVVLALCIAGLIAASSVFKWTELRGGGHIVAEQLGGRLITQNTDNLFEKRLVNVVQEMSIAAGVPVPPVYVMDRERGINAFAAGWSQHDAVVAVTQGCLEHLSREQLQGVVAHEFSHIFNGDMRLNIKLIAVLSGLLVISSTGRICMHAASSGSSGSRRGSSGGLIFLVLGLALLLIGWLGQLCGRIIQAAVSRQREFLADASAVKFTRNPEGIGGALIAIGGHAQDSQLNTTRAEDLSHLFFASVSHSFSSALATHPPLPDRIKRILPRWSGVFVRPETQLPDNEPQPSAPLPDIPFEALASGIGAGMAMVEKGEQLAGKEIQPSLLERASEPVEAEACILAMLLDTDKRVRDQQLDLIAQPFQKQLIVRVSKDAVEPATIRERLAAAAVACGAIKASSESQYRAFRGTMIQWAKMDSQITLFEWAVVNIVRNYCDAHFGMLQKREPRYRDLKAMKEPLTNLFALVARSGHDEAAAAELAFNRGCNISGLYNAKMPSWPIERSMTELINDAAVIARAYPLLKPRILKGLVACAETDSLVNDREYCILIALAMLLDIPLMNLEAMLEQKG